MSETTKILETSRAHEPVADQVLFSVSQAARQLGIGSRMLWTYINRGEIRTRRLGARRLIHRREIERFANKDHAGFRTDKT